MQTSERWEEGLGVEIDPKRTDQKERTDAKSGARFCQETARRSRAALLTRASSYVQDVSAVCRGAGGGGMRCNPPLSSPPSTHTHAHTPGGAASGMCRLASERH